MSLLHRDSIAPRQVLRQFQHFKIMLKILHLRIATIIIIINKINIIILKILNNYNFNL